MKPTILFDDAPIHAQITAAERTLNALYAKRAQRASFPGWWWCACGRTKINLVTAAGRPEQATPADLIAPCCREETRR